MRKVKNEKIIEITEEVKVGNIILEKGDKIRVLAEYSNKNTAKDVAFDAIENIDDWLPYEYQEDYFNSDLDDRIEIIGENIDKFFDKGYEDEDFISNNRNKIIKLIVNMLQR